MSKLLLVYGSLRQFHHNNRLMADCEFVREVRVPGFSLYALGWYPGVKHDLDGEITCEMYKVPEERLRRLDGYEGYNEKYPDRSLFVRETFFLPVEEKGLIETNIYVYNGAVDMCTKVESGDWKEFTQGSSEYGAG